MEIQYCWRCREPAPMFDEVEFIVIRNKYGDCIKAIQEHRKRHGLPLRECGINDHFRPPIDLHERMTGIRISNHNAIIHHERARYGAPCESCGKLLRTPSATKCFECGQTVT